jgi:site-specific DNA-methyltransferase (adenine-specific)
MFSFAGDTVLDPFLGTGSTSVAAVTAGRNSIGVEIDEGYIRLANANVQKAVTETREVGAVEAELIHPKKKRKYA